MPALWLAQLLCPSRHAICGLAYDCEATPREEIEEKLALAKELLGVACGLCGSRDLHIEHGKLFTDDWDEAVPVLQALQAANLRTREFFRRPGSDN
jgi:hypothetical protein